MNAVLQLRLEKRHFGVLRRICLWLLLWVSHSKWQSQCYMAGDCLVFLVGLPYLFSCGSVLYFVLCFLLWQGILSVHVLHPVPVLQPCPLSPLGLELAAVVVPCRSGQASHPSESWRPSFRSPAQDCWMRCVAWEPFRHQAFRYLDAVVGMEATRKAADRKILLSAAFASSPGGIKLRCSFNFCLPLFG